MARSETIAGCSRTRVAARSMVFVLLVFGMCPRPAAAQVTAAITGKVQDATGAAVADASITVTNLETGAIRVVMTDGAGNFRVLSLPLGQQEIKA
jgi:hypothetical protein